MDYTLYIGVVLATLHCICTVHVYGRTMYRFMFNVTRAGTRNEWLSHRAVALVLALCVPIITTVVIYLKYGTSGNTYCFVFFYPYDNLQQQECDDSYLVNIWTGKSGPRGNITKRIRADWEKLNEHFKDTDAYGYDTG